MNLSAINSTSNLWAAYRTADQSPEKILSPVKPEQMESNTVEKAAPDLSAAQTVAAPASADKGSSQQDLGSAVSEQMADMVSSSAAAATSVSTNTSLPDLYKFSNQYLYSGAGKTWAKLDTDENGSWSRDELAAYAQAYEKATGKTLDVDALMTKYETAPNSGVIDYFGQNKMYEDDALGISYVQDEILRAEMGISNGGGSSSGGKVNEKALDDFVNKYTYGYPGKLYANIDHNEDGVWTKDEVMSYFNAYNKATGKDLDGEAIFAKYDRDANGYLTYTEMNEMYKDDALGLSHVKDLLDARKTGGTGSGSGSGSTDKSNSSNDDRLYNTLMDMWGSKFSSSELRSLATTFNQGMQKAAMLDAFMYANNNITFGPSWGRNYYGYGSNTSWMAGNISMLQMFVK